MHVVHTNSPNMTSRLDELRQGLPDVDSVDGDNYEDDIEAGMDPESERLMDRFNRETAAIQNVLNWARTSVDEVDHSFAVGAQSANPNALDAAGKRLDSVEEKLGAVRKRLKRIAGENQDFKRDYGNRTAVVRSRVIQYKKLGQQFIDITKDLESVRLKHREALERSVRSDVMRANPHVSGAQVDAAMANGDSGLDQVLGTTANTAELRHQIQDIKARNLEIQKLSKSLVELHTMFTDMSILVEGQQELLNNIEYNVEEAKQNTEKAGEELVVARKHQKSRNKKKIILCVLCVLITIGIALAIIIPIGNTLGWFNGGGGNNSTSTASGSGSSPSSGSAGDTTPSTDTGSSGSGDNSGSAGTDSGSSMPDSGQNSGSDQSNDGGDQSGDQTNTGDQGGDQTNTGDQGGDQTNTGDQGGDQTNAGDQGGGDMSGESGSSNGDGSM